MPLALLSAPRDTEVLVMEMAMRGLGQIEQLCEIAEPDVAAITNIGPVHLELLGTLEAIAAAKAEILHGLGAEGRAVIPEDAEALSPHLHDRAHHLHLRSRRRRLRRVHGGRPAAGTRCRDRDPARGGRFELPFTEAHNLANVALRGRDRGGARPRCRGDGRRARRG